MVVVSCKAYTYKETNARSRTHTQKVAMYYGYLLIFLIILLGSCRTSEILNQLKLLYISVSSIPVQVLLTGYLYLMHTLLSVDFKFSMLYEFYMHF